MVQQNKHFHMSEDYERHSSLQKTTGCLKNCACEKNISMQLPGTILLFFLILITFLEMEIPLSDFIINLSIIY